jgi:hypothetical protein
MAANRAILEGAGRCAGCGAPASARGGGAVE